MDELYEDKAVSSSPVPGLLYTAGTSTSSRMNRCLHGLMMITIYAILDEEMEERDDGAVKIGIGTPPLSATA